MVTVMVVVIVAGAVSVVYILAGNRGPAPRADAAPPTTAPPTAAPSTAAAFDQCLVGVWTLTRWSFTIDDDALFTSETGGGTYRYRADGTGEWDFGSGVEATGTRAGKPAKARIAGRVTFEFTTTDGTINYRYMTATAGIVVYQSGRVVDEYGVQPTSTAEKYTCTGDKLRFTSEGNDVEARRR
jgi:hypothetical protein